MLPTSVSINLTTSNGTTFMFEEIAEILETKFIGNINIGKTSRQKWTMKLILNYDCRSLKYNSSAKTFSKFVSLVIHHIYFKLATFDVQNGNLTEESGQVCFTCYFLEGSQSQGCYIEYNSLIADYYSGNITIVRTSVDVCTASKCVTGIYTSNYNVTFYDMDYNNVPYTTEYAVKLTNVSVTGISFTSPTPHTSNPISVSSSTDVTSSSSSSTTLCTDCDNSKLVLILS